MRRSRTSQPWQYGQCSTSRPHRGASPGTSGSSSVRPVVTSSRRPSTVDPSARLTRKPPSVGVAATAAPARISAAVAGRLGPSAGEQVGRRRCPRAPGSCAPASAGAFRGSPVVDHQHRPAGPGQRQRPGQPGRPTADHHHVVPHIVSSSARLLVRCSNSTLRWAPPDWQATLPLWQTTRRRCWHRSVPACGRCASGAGTTLAQLAEATGISVSTLSRLESGSRKPTLELLLPLARAHQVALDELVDAPADRATRGSTPARSSATG